MIRALAVCFCAGLAAAPAQACTEAGKAAVAQNPDDTDERYALARACAQAGRHEEALAHYDLLLARDADNADWLLGKAQTLVWQQRPREALPLLEHARTVAPRYEDVWRLNVRALEMTGDHEQGDALLAEAERAFPQSSWPAERRGLLAEERLLREGTRISLAASYEELSDDRPAWRALTLNVDKPLDDRRRILGGVNIEERFEARDEQLALGFVQRLSNDWSLSVAGDVAPDAEVLPEWSVAAEAGRALPGNRGFSLRARHASYATVDVNSLAATIEQYAGQFRVAYTLTAAEPSALDTSFSHMLRFARDYDTASYATLALAYGEEAETIAPGVVRVTLNKSIALFGVHWRSAAWGIAWEAGWYEQGDLYDRLRIRLGLEHRF